jgi:glycosyltransferase involved in cell wall biosynthesis
VGGLLAQLRAATGGADPVQATRGFAPGAPARIEDVPRPAPVAVPRVKALGERRFRRRDLPPRVSVVIPALNEAQNLSYVLSRLPSDVYEVVLVDGGSTDGTPEVARLLLPTVRVVNQDRRGKGNALACGFAESRGDIIVMIDADGSMDPGEIPAFIRPLLHGADFAKGSRCIDGGGSNDISLTRSLGNAMLRGTVNLLYGTGYTDLCYGYNAFWRRCLPSIRLDCDGFEVETQMNIRIAKAGLNVVEVPSFEYERIHGESHLHAVRDGLRVARTILRERWGRADRHAPLPQSTQPLEVVLSGRDFATAEAEARG